MNSNNNRVLYPACLLAVKEVRMPEEKSIEERAKAFVGQLDQSDKMLIILRDELYEASWDLMLKDLNARLKGEPFIFKLADKIDKDIQGIAKIQKFEKENGIDLGDFINLKNEGFLE